MLKDNVSNSISLESRGPQRELYFESNYIISCNPSGEPLSRYRDEFWDFSSTSAARESRLSFYPVSTDSNSYDLDQILREQNKGLIAQYLAGGSIRAFPTVYRLNLVCLKWCNFARACQKELFAVLCDSELVSNFLPGLSAVDISLSGSLFTALWAGRSRFGVEPRLTTLRKIAKAASADLPDYQQTPLIPSKIYSGILANLIGQLDIIERNLNTILEVYETCRRLKVTTSEIQSRAQCSNIRKAALERYTEALTRLGFRAQAGGSIAAFVQGLMYRYQVMLMYVVSAFTGMRIGEVLKLPVKNVLSSASHLGAQHWLINGFTHKLHHGIKRETSWVTNEHGKRAIEIALRISDTVNRCAGGNVKNSFLFCSTENPCKMIAAARVDKAQKWAEPLISPLVTQDDLTELERIRLDRDWAMDGILLGEPWPVAFHQLRRSLAVYAHRSGMVSLPSLKAQLQHITEEMTLYYSRDFHKAANVVFDEEHFSYEWDASGAEASYFGMVLGMFLSDDDVVGAGANWLLSDRVRESPVSAHSREKSLGLFRKGQLAFKENALGGCTSTEPCTLSPLEPIPYECLKTNCPNQVVFGKRLTLVIRTQADVVATLRSCSPGSVEHRLEADNLQVLLDARKRFNLAGKL